MGFESPQQESSQEELAHEYMTAYNEYKKVADERSNDLRILDKLRDEVAPQEMIDEQQKKFDDARGYEERLLDKYKQIGEKLTPDTKDKYLRPESPDYLG